MTDIFDRAAEIEEQFRNDAINEQQRRAAKHRAPVSATHCQEDNCGVPIPEARRTALPGVQFCVDCQQLRERQNRT